MKRILLTTAMAVVVVATGSPATAEVDPASVFEQLKDFAGLWKGTPEAQGAEAEAEALAEVIHRFEVSAAGTVVMETMMPGTDHEMINMYFLDGEDLVLTHYCAGGNQPRMRLDAATSSESSLVFDFDGGTNLEGASHHIHSANLVLKEDGGMESRWFAKAGDEVVGGMTFHLARAASE